MSAVAPAASAAPGATFVERTDVASAPAASAAPFPDTIVVVAGSSAAVAGDVLARRDARADDVGGVPEIRGSGVVVADAPRSWVPNCVRATYNFIPNQLAAHPTIAKVIKVALGLIGLVALAAFVMSSAVYFAPLATGKFIAPIVVPFASVCATGLNYAGVAATGKFVAASGATMALSALGAVRV